MSFSKIKDELTTFDKVKLIALISDLYKTNKSVKEYLDFLVSPNEDDLIKKYKQKIYDAFYPKRGFSLKLKEAKQIITDFKKLKLSNVLLADLMLFYVECGVKFTNEFGDINEAFYLSIGKMYAQTLALLNKEEALEIFRIRALKVVDDTQNIAWGFHEYLAQNYFDFYFDDHSE